MPAVLPLLTKAVQQAPRYSLVLRDRIFTAVALALRCSGQFAVPFTAAIVPVVLSVVNRTVTGIHAQQDVLSALRCLREAGSCCLHVLLMSPDEDVPGSCRDDLCDMYASVGSIIRGGIVGVGAPGMYSDDEAEPDQGSLEPASTPPTSTAEGAEPAAATSAPSSDRAPQLSLHPPGDGGSEDGDDGSGAQAQRLGPAVVRVCLLW